jgi:hypothetical protein
MARRNVRQRTNNSSRKMCNGAIAREATRDAMKLPRRNFLHLLAGAAALPTVSRFAWAQAYPSRPVRIIVGFAPCPCRKLGPHILMMQSAQDGAAEYAANGLDSAVDRRILVQG